MKVSKLKAKESSSVIANPVGPIPSLEASALTLQEYQPNLFTRQFSLSSLISFKCTHIIFFVCWLGLVVTGTTLIGFGALNYSATFTYCSDGQPFCFYDVTMDSPKDIYIYAKLKPFYQNNRLYMDAYSYQQMMGQNGTGSQCDDYTTYGSLGVSQTVGGYRTTPSQTIHPCGFPMLTIFNDSVYVVDSQGGTPNLTASIISNYSLAYRFSRLNNYQLSQWVDTISSQFISWFTVATTSTKYMLMGRLNMNGTYRLVVKNSYPTHGDFTKQIMLSEVNSLGVTNHLLGFTIFAYGIGLLLIHVALCCKSKNNE